MTSQDLNDQNFREYWNKGNALILNNIDKKNFLSFNSFDYGTYRSFINSNLKSKPSNIIHFLGKKDLYPAFKKTLNKGELERLFPNLKENNNNEEDDLLAYVNKPRKYVRIKPSNIDNKAEINNIIEED